MPFARCIAGLLAGSMLFGGLTNATPAPRASLRFAAQQPPPASALGEREQGRALLRRGRAAEALGHLERAIELFRQAKDSAGEASVQDLLGDLYERQGQYETALRHYEAASSIFTELAARESGQTGLVGALSTQEGTYNANLMLSKIAQMHYRRGDVERARAALSQMHVVAPEKDQFKAAQNSKSNVQSKIGKFKGLGGSLRGALGGTPSTSTPTQTAAVLTDTANTLKGPFNAYRETVIYSSYELSMGRVDYLDGQLDSARTHYENVLSATLGSLPVVGKLRETRRYRTAARTDLGDIAFRQGRYRDAEKLYQEAIRGAQEDGRLDLMWSAQRGLGRTAWALAAQETSAVQAEQLRQSALTAYREALATIENLRQGSLRADDARTSFLATTADVFNEATALLAESALRAQAGGAAANTSAPLTGAALAYASEALGIVEQGRARSLLDLLSETGAEITEGVPAELLKHRREVQEREAAIAAQLTGINLPGAAPQKSPQELEAELSSLQDEFESVENQIRTASPRYAALTEPKPLTVEEIRQRVLDDETALVEYSLGEPSYLFALTRAGMTVSRLPARAEIEKQVLALRQQIVPEQLRRSLVDVAAAPESERGLHVASGSAATNPAAVAEYAQAAYALYKSVVEPAAPLVKGSRLLIVADGALNYVPFHALVTALPQGAPDFSTLSYLFRTNDTLFAPSASVIAALRQQRADGTNAARAGSVLLIADPVFDPSDARLGEKQPAAPGHASTPLRAAESQMAVNAAQTDAPADAASPEATLGVGSALADVATQDEENSAQARPVLARLAGTRAEAQQIARLASGAGHKADVWLDLDASESNVEERDLRQYAYLHFATHGLLDAQRPQFTGLVLSLVENRGGGDGFLRTDEVFNLRLGAPFVMLSACETGLGKVARGEGLIGLTRAFMYAGAPAVGVSLWSVADRSTADLMTDFYKNLFARGGASPAAAMRAVRQSMVAGRKYSAPFYWAPFALVGEWR